MDTRMHRHNIISGLVFASVAVYALVTASSFPQDHVMGIGPNYFPTLLSIALLFFSLILVGKSAVTRNKETVTRFDPRGEGTKRLILSFGVSVGYVLVLPFAGFILTSIGGVAILMGLLGVRKLKLFLTIPPLVSFAVYLLFEKFLSIVLPSGILKGIR
ncbi:MAG: tripartite tricarboxylate transporter TctB family protein [Spirochaetes bacterium]|nr:tripartite tricarboxylate transporter TctB family protein [Spirochaetota bacterium]